MIQTLLVRPGERTQLIELATVGLDAGEALPLGLGDRETLAVVLRGTVEVTIDGRAAGLAGGRANVFEGPGHAIYLPPGGRANLLASGGPVELAVATAPLDGAQAGDARVIRPEDQRIAEVGRGNWKRTVRTILGPEHAAGRLLLGETVNPPGNWSSYPPHKHDEHRPPAEVRLEEVYLFKVDPPGGFGVQIRYTDQSEELFTVRDGDTAAITAGFHPVVAAPGYRLYYLWAMAGQGRQMIPRLDPRHAWVQQDGLEGAAG